MSQAGEVWHSVRAKRVARCGPSGFERGRDVSLQRKSWHEFRPKGVRRVGALCHRESDLIQGGGASVQDGTAQAD